jgi:hypothetical protein
MPVGSVATYKPENILKDIQYLLETARDGSIAFDLLVDIVDDLEKSGIPVEAWETYKKILKFVEEPDKLKNALEYEHLEGDHGYSGGFIGKSPFN